jgi:hypothetical protein
VTIIEFYPELGSWQCLNNHAFHLDLILFFGHYSSRIEQTVMLKLFADLGELASFDAANCFFLFYPAEFTFGDEPAFAPEGTQNTALDHLLAEPFH